MGGSCPVKKAKQLLAQKGKKVRCRKGARGKTGRPGLTNAKAGTSGRGRAGGQCKKRTKG